MIRVKHINPSCRVNVDAYDKGFVFVNKKISISNNIIRYISNQHKQTLKFTEPANVRKVNWLSRFIVSLRTESLWKKIFL